MHVSYDNLNEDTAGSDTLNSIGRFKDDNSQKKSTIIPFQNINTNNRMATLNEIDGDMVDANVNSVREQSINGVGFVKSLINEKIILESRPFAVPFDHKNCIVQICAMKETYDNIFVRVISTTRPPKVYSEISLLVDEVEQIIDDASSTSSMIHQVSNHEDIQVLRTLLLKLFHDEDSQGIGKSSTLDIRTVLYVPLLYLSLSLDIGFNGPHLI